jgi:putative nucleotidyltransferase with HDIG domain
MVVGIAVGVIPDLTPSGPAVSAGTVAQTTLRAPRNAIIENPVETQAAKDAAAALIPPQYDFSDAPAIARRQLAALQNELVPLDHAFSADTTPTDREQTLKTALPSLSGDARTTLDSLDITRWPPIEQASEQLLNSVEQGQELRTTTDVPRMVHAEMPVGLSLPEQNLVAEIVTPLIVPNSIYSESLTTQRKQTAMDAVEDRYDTFQAGQVIVDEGHVISPANMVAIDYFGIESSRADWARQAAWIAFGALVSLLLLVWLWRYRPEYWHRGRTLVLIGLVLVLMALAEKFPGGRAWIPYLVPTAAAGMLLAVLLDAGVAVVVLGLLAVMVGINGSSMELAAYVLLGGLAGIMTIRKGERLHYLVEAAAAVAITQIAVAGVYTILGQHDAWGLVQISAAAVAGAVIAGVLTFGSFALLGNIFGILTGTQLLELANPSQSLLRRLVTEAPGTYHHSLMVGNLAERAAEAIGADPLLARVASYYHDVGKLGNPMVFIENQPAGDNVHDQLEPEDSAAILRQHVADGIALATKAKLPKPLIAFIPQHHGTSLISFFYSKAREQAAAPFGGLETTAGRAAADAVDPADFRHSGPKPQSREAAVLMLADGVEASVRSLSSRDEPAIRAMVTQIIGERLADGQLNECDLTIRDLESIRQAFISQLLGMYHQRIAYPQNKVVEIESRRGQGVG